MPHRTVFFISDGTGITAETFGNAILAQFEMKTRHIRLPFVDSVDKDIKLFDKSTTPLKSRTSNPLFLLLW
jgi:regulator of PEP synthase PpsR (kinase-PPPase family)